MVMRNLLTSEYIPFGTQYYRAPSPAQGDWERDLAAIAALGLNTVKFWIQWRWNAPREGSYVFDDIDELMDLAGRHNLRVMLNTIVDVAPAWIYRKYPDASMVTLSGRRVGPQTQPHRQIGGLGVCFNHAGAMDHLFDFLRTTVRRYAQHPALEIWNVGSEPELTSSMAELRQYADDAAKMGDMLCYCDNCRRAFPDWLRDRYRSIAELNTSWNRNYESFEEIELPRTRNTFNDLIDWRMFFVHTLGENVRRRFAIAREEDGGRHPLMCHHVFVQGFPVTSTANDPWKVGELGDLHGITQMDDPAMCDVLRSCAKGRPVISAEMLMLFGYTLDLPKPVSPNDVKRYVFNGVAANLKGFIFWQYRPETLGREAPAWGLTFPDGSPSPWLNGFAEVNRVIQKNSAFLLDAAPVRANVAILYNPENQVFGWAATGSEKTVTDSLLGMHNALYEDNIIVDFIHAEEVERGIPAEYKVLIVPFPYFLSAKVCSVLEAWVKSGGVLIGESFFGGWDAERGRHQTTIPGYAMHKVFGARQGVVSPAGADETVGMTVVKGLPPLTRGSRAAGMIVKEELIAEGAEVLATFDDGMPAITASRYGKGEAILIGSYIALPYYRGGNRANADLIVGLVDKGFKVNRPQAEDGKKIRVDILFAPKGGCMVIMRNLENSPVDVLLSVPGQTFSNMKEEFSGETLSWKPAGDGVRTRVKMQAGEVKVYRG
jgi:beta-galactosidase